MRDGPQPRVAVPAGRPRPKGAADRIALPFAGDDPVAKAAVMDLVEAVGSDASDARRPRRGGTRCLSTDGSQPSR